MTLARSRKSKARHRIETAVDVALIVGASIGLALLTGAFAGLVLMLLLRILHEDFARSVPAAGFWPCWAVCACVLALLDIFRRKK
jgi:integral membrane sensor domain MASE1